jgi:hypothetical protein
MNDTQTTPVADETTVALDRARKGLAWLRSEEAARLGFDPSRIDATALTMNSPYRCALAQSIAPERRHVLWAPYPSAVDLIEGVAELDDAEDWGTEWDCDWFQAHGFTNDPANGVHWEELDAAWQRALDEGGQ